MVTARGLGDALLSMIVSDSLLRAGHHVETHSTVLCGLSTWFPTHTILPHDTPIDADFIIAADHSPIKTEDSRTTIFFEHTFDKKRTMVDNLVHRLQQMDLPATPETGIQPPALTHKKHPMRVILSPTSNDPQKNWPADKFRALAKKLERRGYHPLICVAPHEKADWPDAQICPTVADLATLIYESGALIGNDSGPGHLASLLGIPTYSLFARKSYSSLWRPGWGDNTVITSPIPLPGSRLKQKFWKHTLLPSHVLSLFALEN